MFADLFLLVSVGEMIVWLPCALHIHQPALLANIFLFVAPNLSGSEHHL